MKGTNEKLQKWQKQIQTNDRDKWQDQKTTESNDKKTTIQTTKWICSYTPVISSVWPQVPSKHTFWHSVWHSFWHVFGCVPSIRSLAHAQSQLDLSRRFYRSARRAMTCKGFIRFTRSSCFTSAWRTSSSAETGRPTHWGWTLNIYI